MGEFADFNVDLDLSGEDVKAWGGEGGPKVPPGDYIFNIIDVENVAAKTSGAPMIKITLEVAEGEHAGGRAYNNYNYTNKVGAGRLKQLMIACGADLGQFQASQVMGQQIRGTVVHSTGAAAVDQNGNTLPPATFVNVINELPLESAEAADPEPEPVKPPPAAKAATASKPATNGAKAAGGSARRA